MKKKNEVIAILNAGGRIKIDTIYRRAEVCDATGENWDTVRYDVAERLEHTPGYVKVKTDWYASYYIEKEAAAEAAEEAEEAQEDAAPEYLDERWPESNQQPGIVYILEWNTPGSASHHTRAETVADVHDHVQQIARLGGRITSAKRYDETTGKFRDFIPETRQEKTDRENREHCRRIAEELEAYADGRVYRCPDCGREYTWEQVEASEHEDDCGWAVYTCPGCGAENREDDWEQLSLYDFFSDCLDVEYRCGSDRQYRSVSIMVSYGGPNIYIDTAEKAVLLYWWTDRARYYISSDAAEAVDAWAEEYWKCL